MKHPRGITALELLFATVIGAVVTLMLLQFFTIAFSSWRREDTKTIVQNNTKIAVDTVAQTIRSAKSVEATNSQPDPHAPGAPNDLYSWTATSGSNATLILAVPARDAAKNLIYIDSTHTALYTDNIVYYLDPNTDILYRRTIANAQAPNNAAVSTCPTDQATPQCPADAKVVEDIANLTTSYLNASGDIISQPTGTEAVTFTLTQTRIISGRTYSSSYGTTATLRNK